MFHDDGRLVCRVTAEVDHGGAEEDLLLDFWSVRGYWRRYDDHIDGFEDTLVGRANFVTIHPYRFAAAGTSLDAEADVHGGDLFHLAQVAFEGDFLADDLERRTVDGTAVLFMDRVEIDEVFRGRDLGRHLAATAIDLLGGGCSCVLTIPAPAGVDSPDHGTVEHDRSVVWLTGLWAGLGFEPVGDGVAMLTLGLVNPELAYYLPVGRGR